MAGIAFTSPSLLFLRHKIRKILKHCVERGERGWWLYGGLVPGLQQQYRALIGAAAPGGLCARPQWGGRGRHLACVWGGEKGFDTRSPSPPPLPFSRDIKLSISLLTSSGYIWQPHHDGVLTSVYTSLQVCEATGSGRAMRAPASTEHQ